MDRLRAADPAASLGSDPRDPAGRALLDRVVSTPVPAPARHRRLVIGIAGATVAAAVAAFFIATPASAYTVDKRPDGSVAVTFRPSQLRDPARLNAALARAGARTVVIQMVPADRCSAVLNIDPLYRFSLSATPEDIARFPVAYSVQDGDMLITIQPSKIPAGEVLAFGYAIHGHTTMAVPAVVPTLPSCMAIPTPPRR
jgi:hypothetical protein